MWCRLFVLPGGVAFGVSGLARAAVLPADPAVAWAEAAGTRAAEGRGRGREGSAGEGAEGRRREGSAEEAAEPSSSS